MWRDVSDEIELKKTALWHDSQQIGVLRYGVLGIWKHGYRFQIIRDFDSEGIVNRFFIEQEYSLKDKIFRNEKPKIKIPFMEVRMKMIEVATDHFVVLDKIEDVKRVLGNRSKITLDSGQKIEIQYDVKRFKEKMEELDK